MATTNEAGRYKFVGDKEPGHRTDRLLLEGKTSDPEAKWLYRGESADLTEEQVTAFRKSYELRKASDSSDDSEGSEDSEEEKKSGEGEGEGPPPNTKQETQARQQAAMGQKPTKNS